MGQPALHRKKDARPIVMVVDDDPGVLDTMEAVLEQDYRVVKARSGEESLVLLRRTDVHVVLLDILMPGVQGTEVLKEIKKLNEYIEVIMLTAVKDISHVVEAMKAGAFHYITKGTDYEEILTLVRRALENREKNREIMYLRQEVEKIAHDDFVIGNGPQMRRIYEVIQKVAALPTNVLIQGESGTGKELVARLIHKMSASKDRPFVPVNVASIPDNLLESTLFGHERGSFTGAVKQHIGKFELASGGTLFLDEIGELPMSLQAKLLRAIQEGEIERVGGNKVIEVDVRIIASTNRNLEDAVRNKTFREDLYYRLNVIPIALPPLRQRRQDIPDLAQLFIRRYNRKFHKAVESISDDALQVLMDYPWPGNVRELENVIERLIAITDRATIDIEDIPLEYQLYSLEQQGKQAMPGDGLLRRAVETFEKNFILRTLEMCHNHKTMTAQKLGIPFSTFKYKIEKYGLKPRKRGRKNLRTQEPDQEDQEPDEET